MAPVICDSLQKHFAEVKACPDFPQHIGNFSLKQPDSLSNTQKFFLRSTIGNLFDAPDRRA